MYRRPIRRKLLRMRWWIVCLAVAFALAASGRSIWIQGELQKADKLSISQRQQLFQVLDARRAEIDELKWKVADLEKRTKQ